MLMLIKKQQNQQPKMPDKKQLDARAKYGRPQKNNWRS
jgi:hypothetical protein